MADRSDVLDRAELVGATGFYVTGEDWLRLTSYNAVASVRLTLSGRHLGVDQLRPRPFAHPHTPNTDRTAATSDFALEEGWLQNVTVVASSGSPAYGGTYVMVDVIRGRGAAAQVVATLLQGYVSGTMRRGWPGSVLQGSTEGPGRVRSITGTDPAANVEISETVPTGATWALLSFRARLVTDANAANREVSITVDDGTTVYGEFASGSNQAASLTRDYTFANVGFRGAAATAAAILGGIPAIALAAGHRIATVTTNRQATDNWGAPQLLVLEWLEP